MGADTGLTYDTYYVTNLMGPQVYAPYIWKRPSVSHCCSATECCVTLDKLTHLAELAHLKWSIRVLGQRLVSLNAPCSLLSTENFSHGFRFNSTGLQHDTPRTACWFIHMVEHKPMWSNPKGQELIWGEEYTGTQIQKPQDRSISWQESSVGKGACSQVW